jgi:hypothetical protein
MSKNDWYEYYKRKLIEKNPSAEEYEKGIAEIIKKVNI